MDGGSENEAGAKPRAMAYSEKAMTRVPLTRYTWSTRTNAKCGRGR